MTSVPQFGRNACLIINSTFFTFLGCVPDLIIKMYQLIYNYVIGRDIDRVTNIDGRCSVGRYCPTLQINT